MDQGLRIFITVAKTRSFSRAAEELHLTQPAVSQQIRSLESRYDTRLFERNNKSVELTPAGKILFREGTEILNQYARTKRLIEDLTQSANGPLSLGASYTFGEYVLPPVLAKFCAHYPQIRPKVTIHNTQRIAEEVRRRMLDIGLVEGKIDHPELEILPVSEDELFVTLSANHPLASAGKVHVKDLADERWILRENGSGTRDVANQFFKDTGLSPKNILEFGSTQVIKESVETGLGLSILSPWSFRKELLLGTLHTLSVQGISMRRHFYALTRATSFHTKAMDLFLDFLTPELHNHPFPTTHAHLSLEPPQNEGL
ncbi:DNA-binding transcriptional regulator, LysR family [Marininema mesophilum]|uniref:DNA-binding transcriptional regulator, LysR family n=1 Tax=Marininema mesophilum TaxID=1048340 RepID=A0A1H3C9G6_9BACL|nr:LysR family transcriptional regulator [Marininema mesophilum]SDX50715.1 DNA-binding transcriptional regulator, LysR family [Marininema mesophilum]